MRAARTCARVAFALAAAAACCAGAHAQTASSSVVPPFTPQQVEDKHKEMVNALVWQGATAMPGAILDGTKILTLHLDPTSLESYSKAAGPAANIIWGAAATGKVLEGYSKGGWRGALTEGAQQATEKGVELATLHGVGLLAGESLAVVEAPLSLTYAGSNLFGAWVRDSPWVGQSVLGLHGTVGDSVNDFYVERSPNALKEWASGVKQVDIDDPAVMQQMMDQATRNRHQATFDAVQQENVRQQAQIDAALAQQAAAATAVATPVAPDPNDGAAAFQAALQAMANPAGGGIRATMAPRSEPAAAPGHVCKLDPKTGCHPGHDEASHPGGCKKC